VSADEKNRSYVTVVRDELHQYTQGLLRENEKLRAMATTLESDKRRLELEVIEARIILEQKEELRRIAETFEAERAEMLTEIARTVQARDAATRELDLMRSRFDDVERENESYATQYCQIETQSSNLSNLYVASYQLHATVEREAVLNTIQEIVVNLIGSEEVAVFEHNEVSGEFCIASSFGVNDSRLKRFKAGDGPMGVQLRNGEVFVNHHATGGDDKLTACVPLKIGERVIGAILVFRLLEHKQGLQPVDHELFELLSIHASTALYCAKLHEASAAMPAAAVAG
jgi:hypothetical protein